MKNKLLIHACCAPCLVAVYDDLISDKNKDKWDIDILWYNTNIHPKIEYEKRKQTFISYVESLNKVPIVLDKYDMNYFIYNSVNLKQNGYSIRCEYCYTSRLEEVFKYAKENGYTEVTTTLLISPYQKHDLLIEVCNKLAEKYDVKFLYKDFRPLFREGQKKARELGLYMQKYCGCIFSIDEGRWQLL